MGGFGVCGGGWAVAPAARARVDEAAHEALLNSYYERWHEPCVMRCDTLLEAPHESVESENVSICGEKVLRVSFSYLADECSLRGLGENDTCV